MSEKINKEVASAAFVHAMLTGEKLEAETPTIEDNIDIDIDAEVAVEETDEVNGIEIDIDLDAKPKKTRKPRTKKEDKDTEKGAKGAKGAEKKPKKTSKPKVPKKSEEELAREKAEADKLQDCDFAEIKKSEKFIVILHGHDIHYKEQLWPIEERKVIYEAARVDSRTKAKRICKDMYSDKVTEEQLEDAYEGKTRYYEVRVLSEIVPYRITTLGYIEIKPNKKNMIKLFRKNMEAHNVVYEEVLSDLKKVVKAAVKYN